MDYKPNKQIKIVFVNPQYQWDRNDEIYQLRKAGFSFNQIAKKFGIKKQRANKIFERHSKFKTE